MLKAIGIFFGVIILLGTFCAKEKDTPDIGEEWNLTSGSFVYISEDAIREAMAATEAKDTYGVQEIIRSGRAWAEIGAKVRILDSKLYFCKVRLQSNRVAWVPYSVLHR